MRIILVLFYCWTGPPKAMGLAQTQNCLKFELPYLKCDPSRSPESRASSNGAL